MEIARNPGAPEGSAVTNDVEQVLERVRKAVASTREAIAATQELLSAAPADRDDEARDP